MTFSKSTRFFYGYWIIIAAFLCTFIGMGCSFFAFSLFVKPLETGLGWSRGEIMIAFTALFLIMGAFSLIAGRMVDRYGVRKVIPSGALVMGLGFILLSTMNALWQLYLGYAVIGAGAAAMAIVPASTAVSNWFRRRRGLAIGIMSSGIGAGGLAMAPFIGGYLIPNLGWRASYLAMAVFIWALVIPLGLFVMKTRPEDMGLCPDGINTPAESKLPRGEPVAPEGQTFKMAVASVSFWLIAISFMLGAFSHTGIIQNQVPHLEDIGFPVATAAAALGGVGLGSAIGKICFGWLCDRIDAKYACIIGLILQAGGILILMNIEPASPLPMLWAYSITMGLGAGSWLPTLSMLISTNFGLASYGAISGLAVFMEHVGTATGPFLAGYIYDVTSSYHWAFLIFLALYGIAIPAMLVLRRKGPAGTQPRS